MAVSALCEDFAGRKLYIADGHHRYETAINYRNWCRENDFYNPGSEYVMMMLADMADEGLVVFPTHRLVRDLPGFHGPELLKACEAEFDVLPCGDLPEAQSRLSSLYEEGRHAFALYGGCLLYTSRCV